MRESYHMTDSTANEQVPRYCEPMAVNLVFGNELEIYQMVFLCLIHPHQITPQRNNVDKNGVTENLQKGGKVLEVATTD